MTHLTNRKIQAIERRGKRIVFTLEDEHRFYIHLGMSGRLTVESPGAAVVKHTHLILELTAAKGKGPIELRFSDPRRFGGVFWLGRDDPGGDMGPEPLSIRSEELAAKLKGTNRFIKTALLDQKLIAGLGNIYVDEALHAAGIYPKTRADRLKREQVGELVASIKASLDQLGVTSRQYVAGFCGWGWVGGGVSEAASGL